MSLSIRTLMLLVAGSLVLACGDDEAPPTGSPGPSGTDGTDGTDWTVESDTKSPSTDSGSSRADEGAPIDGSGGCTSNAGCDQSGLAACNERVCDPVSKACVIQKIPDGTECGAANMCTELGSCQSGLCKAGKAIVCDDANPCTKDNCDELSGCQYEQIPGCPCVPSCEDKVCGGDGCNGVCGSCTEDEKCIDGVCSSEQCQPECDGAECGDDGCGGVCGICPDGHVCEEGVCSTEACVPACDGAECGSDGCDGSCGTCPDGKVCDPAKQCVDAPCVPECADKECGADGCDGLCGVCSDDYECTEFKCVEVACEPACTDKVCGDDGCGGSCGECAEGEVCTVTQLCVTETCEPDCTGKECGSDGCGGVCGTCMLSGECTTPVCKDGTCGVDPADGPCEDGDLCTVGDTCTAGVCVGGTDGDSYEVNDSWIGSILPTSNDCATLDFSLTAWLTSADEDWYWFLNEASVLCDTQPLVKLTPAPGTDLNLCVYYTCKASGATASVTCEEGTPADGPGGGKGCCATGAAAGATEIVRFSVSCGAFTSAEGYVDVHVFGAEPETDCGNYTLKWGDS